MQLEPLEVRQPDAASRARRVQRHPARIRAPRSLAASEPDQVDVEATDADADLTIEQRVVERRDQVGVRLRIASFLVRRAHD